MAHEIMFVSPEDRSFFNNISTLEMSIEEANKTGMLDDFEYRSLLDLTYKLNDIYKGIDIDLRNYIENLEKSWLTQNYEINSNHGQILGIVLSISKSSLDWWEAHPEAGLDFSPKGRIMAAPLWVGADIGGAIWGGVTGAVASYSASAVNNNGDGEVSWTAVGIGALSGAVSTSTGAAGRLGKWIARGLWP